MFWHKLATNDIHKYWVNCIRYFGTCMNMEVMITKNELAKFASDLDDCL